MFLVLVAQLVSHDSACIDAAVSNQIPCEHGDDKGQHAERHKVGMAVDGKGNEDAACPDQGRDLSISVTKKAETCRVGIKVN